jgi:hypothetical protein
MQRATLVRYTAKPGRAAENQALAQAVFKDLKAMPPQPFAYALLRDGDDFLHLFINLAADNADGVVERDSFKAFTAGSADRWIGPPEVARYSMTLIDAVGFEGAMAEV